MTQCSKFHEFEPQFLILAEMVWSSMVLCAGIDLVLLVMLHSAWFLQNRFLDCHPRPRLMVHPFFVNMMDRFEALMRKASWMLDGYWIVTVFAIVYRWDFFGNDLWESAGT